MTTIKIDINNLESIKQNLRCLNDLLRIHGDKPVIEKETPYGIGNNIYIELTHSLIKFKRNKNHTFTYKALNGDRLGGGSEGTVWKSTIGFSFFNDKLVPKYKDRAIKIKDWAEVDHEQAEFNFNFFKEHGAKKTSTSYNGKAHILLPFFRGMTLDKYLQTKDISTTETFIIIDNILIQLGSLVSDLGTLQFDANLLNVMYDPNTNEVHLIDFGCLVPCSFFEGYRQMIDDILTSGLKSAPELLKDVKTKISEIFETTRGKVLSKEVVESVRLFLQDTQIKLQTEEKYSGLDKAHTHTT